MNAPSERGHLRLVKSAGDPLTAQEVAERLPLVDLLEATFGPPAPVYPLAVWRKAFGR